MRLFVCLCRAKGQKNIFLKKLIFDSCCRKKAFRSEKTNFFNFLTLEKAPPPGSKEHFPWKHEDVDFYMIPKSVHMSTQSQVSKGHFRGQKNSFHKNRKISFSHDSKVFYVATHPLASKEYLRGEKTFLNIKTDMSLWSHFPSWMMICLIHFNFRAHTWGIPDSMRAKVIEFHEWAIRVIYWLGLLWNDRLRSEWIMQYLFWLMYFR